MAEGGTNLTFNTSEKLKEDSLKLYNSQVTESVVNEFISIDHSLTYMRNTIKGLKDALEKNWEGRAADAYLHQFAELWGKMNDFGDAFSDFKNLLCEVDTAFRDTDNNLENSMQETASKVASQEDVKPEEKQEKERKSDVGAREDANLDANNLQKGEQQYSTMENAMDPNLSYDPLPEKDVLHSTMGDPIAANLDYTPLQPKDYISSTLGGVVDPNIVIDSLNPMDQQHSTLGAAVDAAMDYTPLDLKDVLSSTMGEALPADLVTAALPMKDYLYSTMGAAVEATLPLNAWLSSTAFGTVMNSIGLDGLGPSVKYASMLIDKYGSSGLDLKMSDIAGTDPNAPILGDYMLGSPQYRAVKESLLSNKVTSILTDCCLKGRDVEQTTSLVGDAILAELLPADKMLGAEDRAVYAQEIGSRVMELIGQKEGSLIRTTSMVNINDEVWHNGEVQQAIRTGLVEAGITLKETKGVEPIVTAEDMGKTSVLSADLEKLTNYRVNPYSSNVDTVIADPGAKVFTDLNNETVNRLLNGYERNSVAFDALHNLVSTEAPDVSLVSEIPSRVVTVITGEEIVFTPFQDEVPKTPVVGFITRGFADDLNKWETIIA